MDRLETKVVALKSEAEETKNTPVYETLPSEEVARAMVAAAIEEKGFDIKVLRLRELVNYCDYFVICSARSDRHARAVYDHVRDKMSEAGHKPLSAEGLDGAQWILADYGTVVLHVFYEPVREFYGLERLWAEAPALDGLPES